MPSRILICEDEERIARFVAGALAAEGLDVDVAADGETALTLAASAPPDLVVLDLRLPGIGGLEVLARLRQRDPDLVVVVLSALGDVATKVAALASGASDYVVKPVSIDELIERVRVHLRLRGAGERPSVVRTGELELDLHARQVSLGDERVQLTDREFRVLEYLMRHASEVVARERLAGAVWGAGFEDRTAAVDVCVSRIRAKIGRHRIENVRGAGYRIAA
jgi:DNA-binding response OmpR family regulator